MGQQHNVPSSVSIETYNLSNIFHQLLIAWKVQT